MADYHGLPFAIFDLVAFVLLEVIVRYWFILAPFICGAVGYWFGVRRGFARAQAIIEAYRND